MAVITRLIDSNATQHHDYDYTSLSRYLIGNQSSVLSFTGADMVLTGTTLSAGTVVVKCTRTANVAPFTSRDFLCVVHLSTDETVSIANNRKIFIEVSEALVNDPALITDAVGLSTASVVSQASYPTHTNYIPLYEIDGGGVVTDVRNLAKVSGSNVDLSTYVGDIAITGNVTITGDNTVTGTTTTGDLTATGTATIATANVTDLTTTNPPTFPAGTTIGGSSPANIATTVEATAHVGNTLALGIEDAHNLYINEFTSGQFLRDLADASGTINIAHGMTKTPKKITFTYYVFGTGINDGPVMRGFYDGTSNRTIGGGDGGSSIDIRYNGNSCIRYIDGAGNGQLGVCTLDATNISITWSAFAGTSGSLDVMREAIG